MTERITVATLQFIKFSVQVSNTNPFGQTEGDKVIETTINRDAKTPGGTTDKLIIQILKICIEIP